MDIDELLRQMREYAAEAAAGHDVRHNERELRWAFQDLDTWLSKGGFLPESWLPEGAPRPSRHEPEFDEVDDSQLNPWRE